MFRVILLITILCVTSSYRQAYSKPALNMNTNALDTKQFLKTMLSSRRMEEKKILVQKLQGMRAAENDGSVSRSESRSDVPVWNGEWSQFLGSIINEIEIIEGNKWAMKRWPIPLPSYRLKLGSMSRLMNEILKNEPNAGIDRKRRALSMLLGQLQNSNGGVRELETESIRRSKTNTMQEMLSRTPSNLETPKYEVEYVQPTWEIRNYKEFMVCSTPMSAMGPGIIVLSSSRTQCKQILILVIPNRYDTGAFNSLAGYIFGKNQDQLKMKMTVS